MAGKPQRASVPQFNPLDPDFPAARYAHYRRFRELDPVHAVVQSGANRTWYLFRHADVSRMLRDDRFVKEYSNVFPGKVMHRFPPQYAALNAEINDWMLFRDPPLHTRMRALVSRAFTPRIVEKLEPHILEIADSLLDEAEASGGMEFVADYAWSLPVTVIAELLGVERGYRRRLRELGVSLARAVGGSATHEEMVHADDACVELLEYFSNRLEERRRFPADDLLSGLAAAVEGKDALSTKEIVSNCILLLFAGHETTVHLLGNGLLALLQHPEQLARLRAEPVLGDSAVEEMLRYDAPIQIVFRIAAEDVEIDGHGIARGERVGAVLGAANRDPEQYAEPDRFDIGRTPGRLTSFSLGIHFCIGAVLARAEGRIGLGRLLERFPAVRLAEPEVYWSPSLIFSSLARLPIRLN